MKKSDRLAAIKKAKQQVVDAPKSPFMPGMPANQAALRGAKTGFNPNPEVAPVRTMVPTRQGRLVEQGTPRLKPGVKARYTASPPVSASEPPKPSRARAPRLGPQRASDALLDAAKAKAQQVSPQPQLPSGAKTGPRLREGVGARRSTTPPLVRPKGRVGQAQHAFAMAPRGAGPGPAPRPMRAAPGSRADLAFAGVTPKPAPAARAPTPPKAPRRVGGGWRGMVVGAGINAAQAGYQELTRKDKKK